MSRNLRKVTRRNTKKGATKGQINSENESEDAKPRMHKIADDVYLYAYRDADEVPTLTYKVECSRMNQIELFLDFTNSKNMAIVNRRGSLIVKCKAPPFVRTSICQLRVKDVSLPWSISFAMSATFTEPNEEYIDELMIAHASAMQQKLAIAQQMEFSSTTVQRNLKNVIREGKVTFIDPDFPPVATSLYSTNDEPLEGATGAMVAENRACDERVVWRRPLEFAPDDEYTLFVDNIEPEDIKQGRLGDCWFLCAIAALAEYPELIQRLFITEEEDGEEGLGVGSVTGLYKMRFCKNGRWQTVTVDDYFPCAPGGSPVYARSHGTELWAMLLEKAYAKLHGSYQGLSLGWAYEAMMDMTGAPCSTYRFDDAEVAANINSGTFWDMLLDMDKSGYILTASTPGEDTYSTAEGRPESGLVPGHAYSLIAAKMLSNGVQIVYIRNPWGSMEWQGAWSDNSPLWTPALRRELGKEFQDNGADDGAFWMSYKDLLAHFVSINVCQVRLEGVHPRPWKETRKKSFFVYDVHSSELSTFMFSASVQTSSRAVFTIHQEDRRVRGARPYIDIGISVLRVQGENMWELVGSTGCTVERQASVEVDLEAGQQYIVVPTTTGAKFRQQDTFTLTSPLQLLSEDGDQLSELAAPCFREVFDRMNMDMDGHMNKKEIKKFLKATQPGLDSSYYKAKAKEVLSHFDTTSLGLTLHGFLRAMVSDTPHSFHPGLTRGEREEQLLKNLECFGYDEDLNLIGSRGVVVAVHTEEDLRMGLAPFNPLAFEEAMELPIIQNGTVKDYPKDGFKIYTKKNGYAGVSIVAKNDRSDTALLLTVNVSGDNIMSHSSSLARTVHIPPSEAKVIHHLVPAMEPGAWSYKYSMSYARISPDAPVEEA